MSQSMILISIGPVQDFIAQARRTRDLWFGSHLLGELARAAALALWDAKATLIFPHPAERDALLPASSPADPRIDAANVILAVLPEGVDAETAAAAARAALMKRLEHEAKAVKQKTAPILESEALFDAQVGEAIEFTAVWAPLPNEDKAQQTRKILEKAMAARKRLRDFQPGAEREGAPRSSLGGERPSVLKKPKGPPGAERLTKTHRRYRISAGEALDAVGLIKRAGGKPDQFVPLNSIAAAPWLKKLKDEDRLPRAEAALFGEDGLNVSPVRRESVHGELFPWDASVFHPSRFRPMVEELTDLEKEERDSLCRELDDWHRREVRSRGLGVPSPYIACLLADGDRMGAALSQCRSVRDLQQASKGLAGFAREARTIVESRDHLGSLVYAGGDDVLAFLPVTTADACAQALNEAFGRCMAKAFAGITTELPTLSVGIGIGHVLDGMAYLLYLGREAEKAAKKEGRDRLVILRDRRSGGQRKISLPWSQMDKVKAWRDLTADNTLSVRTIYKLGDLLQRLPVPEETRDHDFATVLHGEIRLILNQSEKALTPETAQLQHLFEKSYEKARKGLSEWIDGVLIARDLTVMQSRATN